MLKQMGPTLNCIRGQLGNLIATLFANWLASFFYLLFPLVYDIKLRGLHNYSASAPTLITINHKRDLDIPIIASTLHLRKTLFKNKLRLNFIARDDLFDPGFLTAHFLMPQPIGKLCHWVNIAPVMRAVRAYPICHLVHKRIGPLLRDVIRVEGNIKLEEAVKQAYLEEFTKLLGNPHSSDLSKLSVSDFLGYDYCILHQRPTDVGILREGLSRKVRTHSLKTIRQQLRVFVRILDEGGICLLAPEGHLSPDGRFWPVKSGLYRLLSMTETDVKVLPVNTTYDFMTKGRTRIYVTIGQEMEELKQMRKTEVERLVQRSIVCLGPVTLGQLGSEYILQMLDAGYEVIREEELASKLAFRVQSMKNSGFRLDARLLAEHSFHRRLRDFVSYCLGKGILERVGPGSFVISRDKVLNNTGYRHWESPVQYSNNELQSLRELFPTL